MVTLDGTSRRGRPRDEGLAATILASTRDLVTEHGYERVTTEMIARHAGVGKQTIYRRWPGKADLVLEAFTGSAREKIDAALPRGPLARRLRAFLRLTFEALQQMGPAIRSLMAAAQSDPEFLELFKTRFIEPRRHALRVVLLDGGRLRAADVDAAVIALFGAMWYRLLLDEPLDDAFPRALVALILHGLP